MKNIVFVSLICFSFSLLKAQTPQLINYQAVAKDNSGNAISNKEVTLRINILKGNITGDVEYSETHSITTNNFGSFTLAIGGGTPLSGFFDTIAWKTGNKFIKVELDIEGGSNYIHVGTTQLLSVPFALYAEKSGTDNWAINDQNIFYKKGLVSIGSSDDPALYDADLLLNGVSSNALSIGYNNSKDNFLRISNQQLEGFNYGIGFGPFKGGNSITKKLLIFGENIHTMDVDIDGKLSIEGEIESKTGFKFPDGSIQTTASTEGSSWLTNGNNIYYSNGNVGVGINDPLFKLDVRGTSNVDAYTIGNFSASDGVDEGAFIKIGTNDYRGALDFGGTQFTSPVNPARLFHTTGGWQWSNQLNIMGNVGINTNEPKAKLEVAEGDVYISDNTKGIILKSPNGGCWRVTIGDDGSFAKNSISCP